MTVAVVTAGDALGQDDKFCEWLADQGIEPTQTYCVEINNDTATVFQYANDKAGKKYAVCSRCGEITRGTYHGKVCSGHSVAAKKEPFEVKIKGPIPGIGEVN